MRRTLLAGIAPLFFLAVAAHAAPPAPPELDNKSYLLVDFDSGRVLAEKNSHERLAPASLTKMMTSYIVEQSLLTGRLKETDPVFVSEHAWCRGSSEESCMYLPLNSQASVIDMLRGVIIQSGNDASKALAEHIGGNEPAFAELMNREAARLGMKDTHFMNATGLPDPQHYVTARDLSLLASAIIRDFPEDYAKYYSMKEYRYNNITQPNRNRLLWLDPTVDGMKTGHTESAGYCLIASAKRGPRRLLSVVLGTEADSVRAQESLKLLNHGYQYYDAVQLYAKNQTISNFKVYKGKDSTIRVGFLSDFVLAVPKGFGNKVQAQLESKQPLVAPVSQGQVVGIMKVSLEGRPYGEYPVVALDGAPVAGIIGRGIDSIKLWFK